MFDIVFCVRGFCCPSALCFLLNLFALSRLSVLLFPIFILFFLTLTSLSFVLTCLSFVSLCCLFFAILFCSFYVVVSVFVVSRHRCSL